MTPAAIIALIRDAAIVGALVFIIWWIRTSGENTVKVADMQAVQKQLAAQAAQQAQWAQDAQYAANQRTQDMVKVSDAISAQRVPILLQPAPAAACPHPVSSPAAPAPSPPPGAGGVVAGAGKNIRPAINAYEIRLEGVIADCRQALASWPK